MNAWIHFNTVVPFPILITSKYFLLVASPFLPLSIELRYTFKGYFLVVRLSQCQKQAGVSVRGPAVEVEVDPRMKKILPLARWESGAWRRVRHYGSDGEEVTNKQFEFEMNTFVTNYLFTLVEQGFRYKVEDEGNP